MMKMFVCMLLRRVLKLLKEWLKTLLKGQNLQNENWKFARLEKWSSAAADTGRVIGTRVVSWAQQILVVVFMYYLSNSNSSKCSKVIYDEKWDIWKLNILGIPKGIMVILMTIMMCYVEKDKKKAQERELNHSDVICNLCKGLKQTQNLF